MDVTTKGAPMSQQVRVDAACGQPSPSLRSVSSSAGLRRSLIRAFLCAFVALALTPTSRGAFIIKFSESNGNVVATGDGSFNLTSLQLRAGESGFPSYVSASEGTVALGVTPTSHQFYGLTTGPSDFRTGGR
jgi:hypothetical protein